MDWWALAGTLGGLVLSIAFAGFAYSLLRKSSEGAVSAERRRLRTEVLGSAEGLSKIHDIAEEVGRETFVSNPLVQDWYRTLAPNAKEILDGAIGDMIGSVAIALGRERIALVPTGEKNGKPTYSFVTTALSEGPRTEDIPSAGSEPGPDSERFALLLIEYYAYGLVQAKRSLATSLMSSAVGGLVLIGGVALAMSGKASAPTVPIITSLAGAITSGIGALFHRQASESLKHMEGQSRILRQDMKAERDQRQALSILEDVSEPALKAQLQAALVIQFSGATMPSLTGTASGLGGVGGRATPA